MFGAIFPVALAGFLAIWFQFCRSGWTSAADWQLRMIENWLRLSCPPRFGNSPLGQSVPLIVVGAKLAGVQAPTRRSSVSIWLGAPGSRTKMQFFAVLSN